MPIAQAAWEYISLHPQQSLFILATIYGILGGLLSLSVRIRANARLASAPSIVTSHEEHLPISSHFDYSTIQHTWNRLFTGAALFCGAMAGGSIFVGLCFFS
ncbi:hypothetical protein H0A36_14315 [Endozoicomonas sp. SM1973]|uniref:Uncharacterized protein n=1 Tax=Spartinivicinus marinus TaxID=2994442 RepID=A0A853I953_9GAMM|nr:hypothetical protein [Spartinivicinus marinus]MCX4028521.1 hypothetical protein [Spartinivicinus marinus]NYZ67188.1 hypothetical protein [Spartinivicinus marinus]